MPLQLILNVWRVLFARSCSYHSLWLLLTIEILKVAKYCSRSSPSNEQTISFSFSLHSFQTNNSPASIFCLILFNSICVSLFTCYTKFIRPFGRHAYLFVWFTFCLNFVAAGVDFTVSFLWMRCFIFRLFSHQISLENCSTKPLISTCIHSLWCVICIHLNFDACI